uniref:Apolipoprotein M n=1 Tax=Mola mola TaxID=94237 RepID=A0A3Q3X6Z4_MOLML
MFFAACAFAVICLVPVSHSASVVCEDLVQPLDRPDLLQLEGRWALVAGSLKHALAAETLKGTDSVVIDLNNSSYTQGSHVGGQCKYHGRNISFESHTLTLKVKNFNFTVTFFHTSCPDCMLLMFDVVSPDYKSVDLYLLSKRRALDQLEMDEFKAQVSCLNMPSPVVMDPTKDLCPEQPAAPPDKKEEVKA